MNNNTHLQMILPDTPIDTVLSAIAHVNPGFSRYLENLSLNLSPKRRETLNFPPSLTREGV
jgi:hypothetical protein